MLDERFCVLQNLLRVIIKLDLVTFYILNFSFLAQQKQHISVEKSLGYYDRKMPCKPLNSCHAKGHVHGTFLVKLKDWPWQLVWELFKSWHCICWGERRQVFIVTITLAHSMWPMILLFSNEFLEVRVCTAPNYKNSKFWGLALPWDSKR